MDPALAAIVLVYGEDELSREAEEDLALAGFTVVRTPDPRRLLDEATRRTVVALVLGQGVPDQVWRRWCRVPRLRRVPIVVLMSQRPQELLFRWPFGAFVRGDAYVSSADVKRRGAASEAVRTVIARAARVTPTGLERFGEALWYVGSVLSIIGVLLALVAAVVLATVRYPWMILHSAMLIGGGNVLMDLGGTLGLGTRLRLRWGTWIWIVLLILGARFLLVDR